MLIAKFFVSTSLAALSVVRSVVGATAFSSEVSSPPNGQLLTTRGLTSRFTSRNLYKPLEKREFHMKRAVIQDLGSGLKQLADNTTAQLSMISELQNLNLPKKLSRADATSVNAKIEHILNITDAAKDFCKKIADGYPNNPTAQELMKTVLSQGRTFGVTMAQSKRPVGGDGTDLKANMAKARKDFDPIITARKNLAAIASTGK